MRNNIKENSLSLWHKIKDIHFINFGTYLDSVRERKLTSHLKMPKGVLIFGKLYILISMDHFLLSILIVKNILFYLLMTIPGSCISIFEKSKTLDAFKIYKVEIKKQLDKKIKIKNLIEVGSTTSI